MIPWSKERGKCYAALIHSDTLTTASEVFDGVNLLVPFSIPLTFRLFEWGVHERLTLWAKEAGEKKGESNVSVVSFLDRK